MTGRDGLLVTGAGRCSSEKRRILLLAENPMGSAVAGTPVDAAVVAVVRCLTLPYRQHPEYRPDWHP